MKSRARARWYIFTVAFTLYNWNWVAHPTFFFSPPPEYIAPNVKGRKIKIDRDRKRWWEMDTESFLLWRSLHIICHVSLGMKILQCHYSSLCLMKKVQVNSIKTSKHVISLFQQIRIRTGRFVLNIFTLRVLNEWTIFIQ